jgi:hypothetical protein
LNSFLQRQLIALWGFALVAVWAGLGPLDTVFCVVAGAGTYFGAARVQKRRLDQLTDRHFERTARSRREANGPASPHLRRASSG